MMVLLPTNTQDSPSDGCRYAPFPSIASRTQAETDARSLADMFLLSLDEQDAGPSVSSARSESCAHDPILSSNV